MKRRLLSILATLSLLVAVVGTGNASAFPSGCSDTIPQGYHTGFTTGTNYNGGWAYIDPDDLSSSFAICSPRGPINNDGPAAYVGIQPGGSGDTNAILQVGITKCDSPVLGCDSAHTQYWTAAGGCGYPPIQNIWAGHVAGVGPHAYQIVRGTGSSSSWWYAYIDSTLIKQWNGATDSHLSCWINGQYNRNLTFDGESADRGDSLGSPSGALYFTSMTYYDTNNVSHRFNISSSVPCSETGQGQFTVCNIYSTAAMYMYKGN
jgi:hypothetical protein